LEVFGWARLSTVRKPTDPLVVVFATTPADAGEEVVSDLLRDVAEVFNTI
jgi:hypothetical protein